MKRFIFLTAAMLVITFTVFAQNKMMVKKITDEKTSSEGKYLIDAHPLLEKFYKANGIDFSKASAPVNSLKKTAWNFTVGTQKNWYAQDLTTNGFYSDPTTCRGIGKNCYVFVEDSAWTAGHVNQNAVDQIINAFDNTTPADPTKGVYEMDVNTFGNPPDVDGDPKIIIVILNIRDGFKGSGGFTAGYFSPVNEYPVTTYIQSNVGEFYYMDCNPLDLMSSSDLSTALQITAHEFQHMIEWNYHRTTENSDFFNEGCSMIAEVVCGYPLRLQSDFVGHTNVPTFTWNNNPPGDVLSDYGRAARFFLYVKEQLGTAALGKFVQSKLTDDNAFNVDVFPNFAPTRNFANFTVDWWIANYLNDKSVDSKWGYDYPNLPAVTANVLANPNTSASSSVYKQGVQYLSYISGTNLNFTTNTNGNTDIKVKAIETGTGGKQIVDVATNSNFSVPGFGTTYSNIAFMIYHNNKSVFSNGPFAYTYSSTGTAQQLVQEIAYDQTEPTGIFSWSVGDTMAVRFDGIAGMKLDSIRVALRNTVPIEGGIWKAGTSNFLSTKLATFTVTGKTIPDLVNPKPYVYEQPYPNWITYDLRSQNIDASSSFVVAFPVKGKYTGATGAYNNVMITSKITNSPYHSYTYLVAKDASSGSAGWYFVSDSDTSIALYLIRAYVSNGVTGVNESVELLPTSYKLDQNYPNPFNPSTVIRYELPKMGNVQIKIYDALGQEVRSLIDEEQNTGTHNVLWDGANNYGQRVSSGIYFYRIVAGDFVQTKKMIMMK